MGEPPERPRLARELPRSVLAPLQVREPPLVLLMPPGGVSLGVKAQSAERRVIDQLPGSQALVCLAQPRPPAVLVSERV